MLIIGWVLARRAGRAYARPAKDPGGTETVVAVGLVTLPGAFVGVLLSTGSAAQAGAVQILVLIALLLSQTCGVAITIELIARGMITRQQRHRRPGPRPSRWRGVRGV